MGGSHEHPEQKHADHNANRPTVCIKWCKQSGRLPRSNEVVSERFFEKYVGLFVMTG